jgi:hypothetical protein
MTRRVLDWLATLPGKVADAIVVPVLVVGGIAVVAFIAAAVTARHVPLWAVIVGILCGLVGGLLIGRRTGPSHFVQTDDLAGQAAAGSPYDTYVEHVRDALSDLRKAILGELPGFSLRDFVEVGIFQPAHLLLARSGTRGELRFSVLHVDDEDFVMSSAEGTFPAFGHRPESRQKFRLRVAGSFSQLAYERNRMFFSGKLSEDDRFEAHDAAEPARAYESIVSVPLRTHSGEVDGVMNVIATATDAFSAVDRTYISLLGSVVDVARAHAGTHQPVQPNDMGGSLT